VKIVTLNRLNRAVSDVTFGDGKRFTDVCLCPALLKYFGKPPKHIAATVTPYANRFKNGNKTALTRETQT
jgi:hypothetical protein